MRAAGAGAVALSLIAGITGGVLGARSAQSFVHRAPTAPVDPVTHPDLHDLRPAAHVHVR
jgi:hypothetical protein